VQNARKVTVTLWWNQLALHVRKQEAFW